MPRDFVERIEREVTLAPLDARDVPRGEADAMGEALLREAPVPSLTPEIRAEPPPEITHFLSVAGGT